MMRSFSPRLALVVAAGLLHAALAPAQDLPGFEDVRAVEPEVEVSAGTSPGVLASTTGFGSRARDSQPDFDSAQGPAPMAERERPPAPKPAHRPSRPAPTPEFLEWRRERLVEALEPGYRRLDTAAPKEALLASAQNAALAFDRAVFLGAPGVVSDEEVEALWSAEHGRLGNLRGTSDRRQALEDLYWRDYRSFRAPIDAFNEEARRARQAVRPAPQTFMGPLGRPAAPPPPQLHREDWPVFTVAETTGLNPPLLGSWKWSGTATLAALKRLAGEPGLFQIARVGPRVLAGPTAAALWLANPNNLRREVDGRTGEFQKERDFAAEFNRRSMAAYRLHAREWNQLSRLERARRYYGAESLSDPILAGKDLSDIAQ